MQQAAVVGRTFWEGALAGVAAAEGRDLGTALLALQEKDIVVPEAGSRLAGEPELAFKHVLIRDVAYGMLPKAVRARKHFEVGGFIEQRAGDRSDEVVALLAEHYGRAAALAGEARLDPGERDPIHAKALHFLEAAGDAASALYSNREALAHYEAARDRALGAGPADLARIGEKQGDVALRLGRVDAAIGGVGASASSTTAARRTSSGSPTCTARSARRCGTRASASRRSSTTSRGSTCSRTARPAWSWCASTRRPPGCTCRPATTCSRSTPPRRRCAWPSGSARRARPAARTASSAACSAASATRPRRARTSSARSSWRAARTTARRSSRCWRSAITSRSSRPTTPAPRGRTPRRSRSPSRSATCPRRSSCSPRSPSSRSTRADWDGVKQASDRAAELSEREGLVGKLCLPYALRGLLHWRDGDWDEAEPLFRRSHELAEQVGWSEVAFSALFGLAITLRDAGDTAGAVTALAQALDVCERAGLIAQSIQATSARAVVLELAGRHEQAREASAEASELAQRFHYPLGRAAALEAQGVTAADPEEGARVLDDAREAWGRLERPLEAARCRLLAGQRLASSDPERSRELLEQAAVETERLGVPHLAARARALAANEPAP